VGVKKNQLLIAAAMCSAVAAMLHVGCIVFGGDWYRIMGAGEEMARMAEAGDSYPTIVTSLIVALLMISACYALSGAGVIFKLPFLRLALCTIAAVFLLRSVAFIPLMPLFPENGLLFWIISSAICFFIGALYALGAYRSWGYLGRGVF
jgi:hypothetical protein